MSKPPAISAYWPIGPAAEETGVPRRTLYHWVTTGAIPSEVLGNGQPVVLLKDVRARAADEEASRPGPKPSVDTRG